MMLAFFYLKLNIFYLQKSAFFIFLFLFVMLDAQLRMVLGMTSARINSHQTFLHINKTLKIVKNLNLYQLFDMESTMVIKHQGWMLFSRFCLPTRPGHILNMDIRILE